MKKILLLSAGVVILSLCALAQTTKEKSKDVKSNNTPASKVVSNVTKQNKEAKKDTTDWEKKVIEELKLTDSQKERLEVLDNEYNKKFQVLKLSGDKRIREAMETHAAAMAKKTTLNQAEVSETEVNETKVSEKNDEQKVNDNSNKEAMLKNEKTKLRSDVVEENNEKMMELKKEKESAFMQLLTPEQLSKYKALAEKRNKEDQTHTSIKPIQADTEVKQ